MQFSYVLGFKLSVLLLFFSLALGERKSMSVPTSPGSIRATSIPETEMSLFF
jgi:hypothetical protein